MAASRWNRPSARKSMTLSLDGCCCGLFLFSISLESQRCGCCCSDGSSAPSPPSLLFLTSCLNFLRAAGDNTASSKSNSASPDGAVHPRTSPGLSGLAWGTMARNRTVFEREASSVGELAAAAVERADDTAVTESVRSPLRSLAASTTADRNCTVPMTRVSTSLDTSSESPARLELAASFSVPARRRLLSSSSCQNVSRKHSTKCSTSTRISTKTYRHGTTVHVRGTKHECP
mmetsp:Transcript_4919/g.10138  ORF Transcript_4919/g.10138 Transcript_4919/m.10138 type:complete len:232 (+) Transcript_4919:651-1346(+)